MAKLEELISIALSIVRRFDRDELSANSQFVCFKKNSFLLQLGVIPLELRERFPRTVATMMEGAKGRCCYAVMRKVRSLERNIEMIGRRVARVCYTRYHRVN